MWSPRPSTNPSRSNGIFQPSFSSLSLLLFSTSKWRILSALPCWGCRLSKFRSMPVGSVVSRSCYIDLLSPTDAPAAKRPLSERRTKQDALDIGGGESQDIVADFLAYDSTPDLYNLSHRPSKSSLFDINPKRLAQVYSYPISLSAGLS